MPHEFKPSDRVMALNFLGVYQPGRIVKLTKRLATVAFDMGAEEKVLLERLRRETPADVAHCHHARRMRAWHDERPKTSWIQASYLGWGGGPNNGPIGAQLYGQPRTSAEMRAAAAELLQFADWFEKKPGAVEEAPGVPDVVPEGRGQR